MNKFKPILRRPLDNNYETEVEKSTESEVKQGDKKTVISQDQKTSDSIAQAQNKEFRTRLETAGKIILKLQQQQKEQDERYQKLVEQTNQQISELQAENQQLQVDKQKLEADKRTLQTQMADDDARAARIAATDILQEATQLKDNIIDNAKAKADKYHAQTVMQAEAKAHEIKHEADQYVAQAQTRTTDLNNNYIDVKHKMAELSKSLQGILEDSDDVKAEPVTDHDAETTTSNQTQNKTETTDTKTKTEKQSTAVVNNHNTSQAKSTLSIVKDNGKQEVAATNTKPRSLFSQQSDEETRNNAETMANFDDIIKQVEAHSGN